MTTVVDPSGTPSPVYNRSGTTIVEVSAAGTTNVGATPIPAISGHTVALCTIDDDEFGVVLPDDAQVGDVVEVYPANTSGGGFLTLYSPTGETLNTAFETVSHTIILGHGAYVRKVTSTGWWSVGIG